MASPRRQSEPRRLHSGVTPNQGPLPQVLLQRGWTQEIVFRGYHQPGASTPGFAPAGLFPPRPMPFSSCLIWGFAHRACSPGFALLTPSSRPCLRWVGSPWASTGYHFWASTQASGGLGLLLGAWPPTELGHFRGLRPFGDPAYSAPHASSHPGFYSQGL
jgi:hypothetical protein